MRRSEYRAGYSARPPRIYPGGKAPDRDRPLLFCIPGVETRLLTLLDEPLVFRDPVSRYRSADPRTFSTLSEMPSVSCITSSLSFLYSSMSRLMRSPSVCSFRCNR